MSRFFHFFLLLDPEHENKIYINICNISNMLNIETKTKGTKNSCKTHAA